MGSDTTLRRVRWHAEAFAHALKSDDTHGISLEADELRTQLHLLQPEEYAGHENFVRTCLQACETYEKSDRPDLAEKLTIVVAALKSDLSIAA